ncbi:hypothetical protein K1T71_014694 [Dendrolimus kikuchii]|uniref:Uncharacterized protein n=1 Tax=Dendrolimus kikuchii TaxID=765133 RepID=A0ACC1CER9_9NEOP|nr:hypothetical protein K1T71_014694 [Dendrolimus kikuchii]
MRRVSQLFQPLITIPKNAKIKNTEITCKSQKHLLECGLVRPTSSGLFILLPLAQRSLKKLENITTTCIERTGAQRLALPKLTSAGLWEKTGRIEIGPELLKVEDRHGKKYLLAPTHEESIADLLADVGPLSYKQLPLLLYQIGEKYRDEHRPKHGVLRSREFVMLDAYGAHAAAACALQVYESVTVAYRRIFDILELPVHRVEAPTGDMGGSLSHEWQLKADVGEDSIDICPSCSHASLAGAEGERCKNCGTDMDTFNSIEVGHTFILGTKYSEALNANFVPNNGTAEPILMSCYGIGLTRLLAASLEALSDEKSMRWPKAIAPYSLIIIGPKEGSKEWQSHGWDKIAKLYDSITNIPNLMNDVLVDDRHNMTIGKRLMMAERMGYPTIVVCGKSILDSPPTYEIHDLTGTDVVTHSFTLDQLLQFLERNNDEYLKIRL